MDLFIAASPLASSSPHALIFDLKTLNYTIMQIEARKSTTNVMDGDEINKKIIMNSDIEPSIKKASEPFI